MNAFDQHLAHIDGQAIHFVHARSSDPDALPLLLIHGWPASVFEYIKVLRPLSDPGASAADAGSFHVVAPSIPGYGFSGPTTQPGWGPARIAAAFATLMSGLGYDRYGLAGGDWGAIISTELARADAGKHVCGLHLTMPLGEPPPAGHRDVLSDDDQRGLDDWTRHQAEGTVVHVGINSTRPHTLAFGLNDSPAGLAAWLIDKYRSYSDCGGDVETAFTRDELLTETTTYWVTGTIASASRLYYERAAEQNARADTCSRRGADRLRDLSTRHPARTEAVGRARCYANIERWTQMPSGGHFPGIEEPDLLVSELRAFFAMQ